MCVCGGGGAYVRMSILENAVFRLEIKLLLEHTI